MDTSDDENQQPELLTTKEVGEHLRCSERTVRTLIRERRLTAVRVGKRLLVPASDVRGYLARKWSESTSK